MLIADSYAAESVLLATASIAPLGCRFSASVSGLGAVDARTSSLRRPVGFSRPGVSTQSGFRYGFSGFLENLLLGQLNFAFSDGLFQRRRSFGPLFRRERFGPLEGERVGKIGGYVSFRFCNFSA